MAVFTDEWGQTVLTIRADHFAEIDCRAVGIAEDKLAGSIDLRFGDPDPILTAFAVSTGRSASAGAALVALDGSPHAGVGVAQPPVAVCAYVWGKPVRAVFACCSGITFIPGCLHVEGSPGLSAVIGNLPDAITADSELRCYAVCTVLAVLTVGALLALFTGCPHAERRPGCAVVIGDLPLVCSGIDAKLRRGCAGRRLRILCPYGVDCRGADGLKAVWNQDAAVKRRIAIFIQNSAVWRVGPAFECISVTNRNHT